jgi:hypothetical protein
MTCPTVECYSGYTYAQEPRAVIWQGRRYPVIRVEQRWRVPGCLVFHLRAQTGALFRVKYHEAEDQWAVDLQPDDGDASPGDGPNVEAPVGDPHNT